LPTLHGHGDFGGAKCRGNLLRKHAGNNQMHDLALARGQFRVALLQLRELVALEITRRSATAAQGNPPADRSHGEGERDLGRRAHRG